MKCQNCYKPATLHITEVLGENQFEELHLCEECAQKYLYEPPGELKAGVAPEPTEPEETEDPGDLSEQRCEICGMRFVEFRNSGRLGCPHDYKAFQDELTPLLESIHGQTRHCGKTPRRLPQVRQAQKELGQLRKMLQKAITEEAYEEAAKLRDQIRQLGGS